MADEFNSIPQLTLDPTETARASAVPELTLESTAPAAPEPAKPEAAPVQMDDSLLNDAEKRPWRTFPRRSISWIPT